MINAIGFHEYVERFAERHNLRMNIIYDDGLDIVDGIDGSKTILECHMLNSELSDEQEKELDEKIYKYFKTYYPFDVYEAYANFPSEEAYMDYAEFKWSRVKNNQFRNIVQEITNNDYPYNVSPEVYEKVIVKMAVKYCPSDFPSEDIARLKIKTIENPPISGKYSEIAVLTEMKSGPATLAHGYRCLYCRSKMSYSDGFKYYDYFSKNNKLIKSLGLKDIKAVFEYNKDPNILLISGAGVGGFITTLDMITEDVANDEAKTTAKKVAKNTNK